VAQHFDACQPCAAQLSRLHALLAEVAALPRTIEPPPELWTDLRKTLEAGKISPLRTPRTAGLFRRTATRPWVVAAAIVLVAGSVVFSRRPTSRDSVAGTPPPPPLVSRIDRHYGPVLDHLAASLRERTSATPPKTVATVNQSLRIVDSAIAETRAALIQDPDNQRIGEMLSANYQRKLDLLKRASELATEF